MVILHVKAPTGDLFDKYYIIIVFYIYIYLLNNEICRHGQLVLSHKARTTFCK